MATHKLAILVSAIGAAKAAKDLKGVDKAVSSIGGRTGQGLGKAAGNLAKIGAVAGVAVVTGLAAAAKAAIDWQDAFQGVVKTVDETDLKKSGSSFQQLGDEIRAMSREMPNSAIELADIAANAGALGVKAKDIGAFTKQVAILASTTNVSADDAATALGQLQNVIGLTGDEFDNFAAALVDLGNKGASTEGSILEIARRSGAAAKTIGVAKDATLGWAAAAANLGLQDELAGTAVQSFFLKSLGIVSEGGRGLQKFGKIAGMSAKSFAKAFKKDATGALETFVKGLAKLPKGKRLDAIKQFFGKGSGLTRLLLGLAGNTDNLSNSLDTSTQAWKDATAAQVEFDKRNATIKSSFARLKNNIIDAAVTLGEGFAPALGRAADHLSDFLKSTDNRNSLKKLGEDIGKLVDNVDWTGLLTSAKSFMGVIEKTGGYARDLWAAFSAMPEDAKAVLLSLVGISKLTGGAPIKILVDFAKEGLKGVLGQFFDRGSSPANPLFVSGTGIGGGPNEPGGPGGGVGDLVKFGIVAAIPIAVATAGAGITRAIGDGISSWVANGNENLKGFLTNGFQGISTALNPIGSFVLDAGKNLDNLSHLDQIPTELGKIAGALTGKNDPVTPGLTGGAPGRGGATPQGSLTGGAAGRGTTAVTKSIGDLQHNAVTAIDGSKTATDNAKTAIVAAQGVAGRDITSRVTTVGNQNSNATTGGASRVTTQSIGNTGRIVGAIAANRPIVSTTVVVNVSGSTVTSSQTTQSRTGSGGGSQGNDSYGDGSHGK